MVALFERRVWVEGGGRIETKRNNTSAGLTFLILWASRGRLPVCVCVCCVCVVCCVLLKDKGGARRVRVTTSAPWLGSAVYGECV